MSMFSFAPEGISRSAMTAVAKMAAIPFYQRKLRRFEAMLAKGHQFQRRSLFEKIRNNADSDFGKVHGFDRIQTVEDFRRNVPISNYEYMAPYIAEVSRGRNPGFRLYDGNDRATEVESRHANVAERISPLARDLGRQSDCRTSRDDRNTRPSTAGPGQFGDDSQWSPHWDGQCDRSQISESRLSVVLRNPLRSG
jgi:hypothetical protein